MQIQERNYEFTDQQGLASLLIGGLEALVEAKLEARN